MLAHLETKPSKMEGTDSSTGSHHPNLPPGFRFHPTDEELVVHYLKKRVSSSPLPVSIIAEVDLYKYDPWELPAKATFGEHEWYFFSPRDRKYPNGARPNRAATSGYWKATGTDKPVMTAGGAQKAGVKKALVFYEGKPPKGVKTNWIMHEYRLVDNKTSNKTPPLTFDLVNKKNSLRLDDWVLCRIYKKSNINKCMEADHEKLEDSSVNKDNEMMLSSSVPPSLNKLPSTFNNTSVMVDNEQALYELGLMSLITTSASSMADQLASPTSAAAAASLKRPLPYQNFYWVDGDDYQAAADQEIMTNNGQSSKKVVVPRHRFLQGDSNVIVSLHSEAQQVVPLPSQQTTASSLNQFNDDQVGYDDDIRQQYQLAASASLNNWYPT